ncbi:MAG: TetR family transcriptional regulator [Nocardioides sp.]
MGTTKDRLVAAAFELFSADGFDQTTVDAIAARAGVSRATFFRHFPTKEAVVFPDHDGISADVNTRLHAADAAHAGTALVEASAIVLRHYLDEGEVARDRYRLTRTFTDLRQAEIAGQLRYQQIFRQHIRAWIAGPHADLRAEVLANAVVTAHNHVLRAWLRGTEADPVGAHSAAISEVIGRLWPARAGASRVIVVDAGMPVDDVVALLSARGGNPATGQLT